MLDKSIPYFNIIMKREAGRPVPEGVLPQGYRFKNFEPGDEGAWAIIMEAVGEFDTSDEAAAYFEKDYLPHLGALKQRSLFIVNEEGDLVGTYTNWWNETRGTREPSVHWVGVMPAYQGLGLGKALVFEGTRRMIDLEGDRYFYLHTQTWSYRAIGIYEQAGYRMVKGETFADYDNDYDQAMAVLIGHKG